MKFVYYQGQVRAFTGIVTNKMSLAKWSVSIKLQRRKNGFNIMKTSSFKVACVFDGECDDQMHVILFNISGNHWQVNLFKL